MRVPFVAAVVRIAQRCRLPCRCPDVVEAAEFVLRIPSCDSDAYGLPELSEEDSLHTAFFIVVH